VLRRVKQEKADVGEQLADKEELCGQVVLGEHRKNVTIDRLKARLREAGVDEHEIFGLVSGHSTRAGVWACFVACCARTRTSELQPPATGTVMYIRYNQSESVLLSCCELQPHASL
jgi:hypothetical protein